MALPEVCGKGIHASHPPTPKPALAAVDINIWPKTVCCKSSWTFQNVDCLLWSPKIWDCSQIPLRILLTPLLKGGISFSWAKKKKKAVPRICLFFPQFFHSHFADKNGLEVLRAQDWKKNNNNNKKSVTCRHFWIYLYNDTVSFSPYSICTIRNGQLEAATWIPLFQSLKANNNLAGSISTCPLIIPGTKYSQHLGRN